MNIYIWDRLEKLTDNWHPEGGAVAVAENLEAAKQLVAATAYKQSYSDNPQTVRPEEIGEPDAIYELKYAAEPRAFIFPDAGCC